MIKNLTVQIISDVKIKGSMFAMDKTLSEITPERAQFLTSKDIKPWRDDVEIVRIAPLTSMDLYSRFVMYDLHKFMQTDRSMIIQWDGYVLDGSKWNDEFMQYDFIGAPRFFRHLWYTMVNSIDSPVLNGGFSIRSKELSKAFSTSKFAVPYAPEVHIPIYEDQYITRIYRKDLEKMGFTFAPYRIAKRFSVEQDIYSGQLGWHGAMYGAKYTHGKTIADD